MGMDDDHDVIDNDDVIDNVFVMFLEGWWNNYLTLKGFNKGLSWTELTFCRPLCPSRVLKRQVALTDSTSTQNSSVVTIVGNNQRPFLHTCLYNNFYILVCINMVFAIPVLPHETPTAFFMCDVFKD